MPSSANLFLGTAPWLASLPFWSAYRFRANPERGAGRSDLFGLPIIALLPAILDGTSVNFMIFGGDGSNGHFHFPPALKS
jgi:hypothetical protein